MSSYKGKEKAKQSQYSNAAADFNHQFGLDLGFNATSISVDPLFGIDVPYMQPYHNSTTAPNLRFTQAAPNSNIFAPNSFNLPNLYFTCPHPSFTSPTPNPDFNPSNTSNFTPPNFTPLNCQ
ncbi:uncharacterized protein EDB91DRAFT_1256132 [Suillus paluster]|uniref:uncharacterized protein n=1 Tax=Suillus paluster TaxID=48578 RepID=UPI001B87F863|nr:uncharacterized protein EDB91DRAFT_1256132 [Suillus paluster]KAG1722319.1 hypothetical protein EDB91DRAFT_1256132 [Suillus paluster]